MALFQLIFGLIGMALVDSFSRINGYKNHWRDIWVGWLIGFAIALFLVGSINLGLLKINFSVIAFFASKRSTTVFYEWQPQCHSQWNPSQYRRSSPGSDFHACERRP